MAKKLLGVLIICLVLVGLLRIGGYTPSSFGNEVDTKNPVEVFDPLFNKLGLVPEEQPPTISNETDTTTQEQQETQPKQEKVKEEEQSTEQDNTPKVTKEDILSLVDSIKVSTHENKEKYNRDDWEKPAKKFTLDGEKVSRVKYDTYTSQYLISKDPFVYKCPYSGKEITDIKNLDFDHLVPLLYLHKFSDTNWTKEQKNKFAQDENVGVSVLNKENRRKGAKGPSEWLPKENQGDYCLTWLLLAKEYGFALRQQDIDTCKVVCLNEIASGKSLKRMN
jgi:hypothetical protein